MASTEGFFALCMHRYQAQDETHLDIAPGRLVVVWRVEPSGWAGVVDFEGDWDWGWIPYGYVRPIDDETVGVLEPIAQQLRVGAYRAVTTIRATATDHLEGYSSPDSNESDALGDEWANIPRQRRPSRAATRPRDMDTTKAAPTTPRMSLDEEPRLPSSTAQAEKSPGVQFAATSPTSFVPSRVRAFRLRSKSRDGIRSDSESTTRPRRPSVSIRRTRVSMFGSSREPNVVEQIKRLDARPWYLKPVHSSATGDIVLDLDGSVRAGTLEAIVERLTCEAPSRNHEIALRRDILFTYEAFTTAQQLFDLITDQYSLEPPRELNEGQFADWKENKLRPTQARVLDVLGAWLDLPRLCQDDPELMPRMREFLQFVTKPESLAAEARRHLRTIEQLISPCTQRPPTPQRRRRRSEKQRPFPTLSSSPSNGTRAHSHSFSGLLLSPTTGVRSESPQPGLEHTSSLRGRKQVLEWHKTSSGATEDTPNDLRNFCVTSDRLAGWVKWSVLSMGNSVKRAEAVGTWIRVAEKCRLLNNISSLAAIAAGLSSADISRLPHTWHLVPSARSQRLEDLVLLTSPAGGFAQLKVLYSNIKFAVPFLGMYLTAIVHAADKFKDHVPFPIQADKSPRDDNEWTDIGASELVTPTQTQTHARTKAARMSVGIPSPLALSASPAPSARIASEPPTPTLSVPPSSPTASTLDQPKLINMAKRHKQAEIIHAMLKFQDHPYTVSSQSEPSTPTSSTPYPHTPSSSTSSSVILVASAGGVAWVEEQLSRAAKLTIGTDWTYERSLKLYDDETGGRARSVDRENMAAAGF
ncbi:hypothetical protein FRC11_012566 [Ceratobasidium sp. 423]|nr:hypothetical protein FRC11_012566 [Ceratobasidium sp. 423]